MLCNALKHFLDGSVQTFANRFPIIASGSAINKKWVWRIAKPIPLFFACFPRCYIVADATSSLMLSPSLMLLQW
jgi:hypothetical protein